ncbi:MAG: hypothetical protein IJZ50_04325 [Alistipes sp.]|nr:hypothetical protein [Alistipes sp.]MBQ8775062.1 hypothetical protein [Alistipes sp.]
MKNIFIILLAFALCSCSNEESVNKPKGNETTQYVESIIANASTNIDFDAAIEKLTSKALVIERLFWGTDSTWEEDESPLWVGIVFKDITCYSYWYEPCYGSYPALKLRCDKHKYTFEKREGGLYLISENHIENRIQEARLIDYKENTIFFMGELPFPSSYRTSFYICTTDFDIQEKWDAIIEEQDK